MPKPPYDSIGSYNLRFWDFVNGGWVKLTLPPDGTLRTHHRGGPTEEGYQWETESWWFDRADGLVHSMLTTNGRDCDGRYDSVQHVTCRVDFLTVNNCVGPDGARLPMKCPAWTEFASAQRDYAAEAAGY